MRTRWVPFVVLAGCIGAGCAGSAAVRTSESLPLRRVVLYRNGVGYFERHGEFTGGGLDFTVKRREVGDFLSSLTAVDRRGRVRSVSFEVHDPSQDQETAANSGLPPGVAPEPTPPTPAPDDADQDVDVRLRLDHGSHDLTVSYVIAAPLWRPSYRIVFDHDGALLQAWAVVHNSSGEDWNDVHLSLTTGAPIAFRSDLGTPVTPPRPLVTDHGEVVAAVPHGQTTMNTEATTAAAPPPPARAQGGLGQAEGMAGAVRSRRYAPAAAPRTADEAPAITANDLQRSVQAQAAVAQVGASVTRYDLDHGVTVPDGGSTMVAILSKRVPGESAYLFAPGPGVPDSQAHPFRVARLRNRTGAMLERGPVAVLESGDFVGQGLLEELPRDASAFVPFALDRSVVVHRDQTNDVVPGRLVSVRRDRVVIEQISIRKSRYTVRNGNDHAIKIYIRHDRLSGAELYDPPEGVENTVNAALVPVTVPAHAHVRVKLEERTPVQRTALFTSDEAAHAIGLYLEGSAVDAAQGPLLRHALDLRHQLAQVQEQMGTLGQQENETQRSEDETRQNLTAIAHVDGAADLRARLVARLSQLQHTSEDLTRQIVELRTHQSELRVRLDDALSEVSLEVPAPAGHSASAGH